MARLTFLDETTIWITPSVDRQHRGEESYHSWQVRIEARRNINGVPSGSRLRRWLSDSHVERVFLQAASQAQTVLSPYHSATLSNCDDKFASLRAQPGVAAGLVMDRNDAHLVSPSVLFSQLILQHRLLLTSVNIDNPKLHRYPQYNDKKHVWSIVLPSEGSAAFSTEGLSSSEWSDWLLHSTVEQRVWKEFNSSVWMEGMEYVVTTQSSVPAWKDLVPEGGDLNFLFYPDASSASLSSWRQPLQVKVLSGSRGENNDNWKVEWHDGICDAVAEDGTCQLRHLVTRDQPLWRQQGSPSSSSHHGKTNLGGVQYHVYQGAGHTGTLRVQIDTTMSSTVHHVIPTSVLQPRWRLLRFFALGKDNDASPSTAGSEIAWSDIVTELDIGEKLSHLRYSWNESFVMTLGFDPKFWSIDNIPGDPNRGIELPPLTVAYNANSGMHEYYLASNTVLLLPPLPDLSMPFNVLSLTCTLYAFVIGSTMSFLLRKASQSVQEDLDPSKKPPSKLQLLKQKLGQLKAKVVGKLFITTQNKNDKGDKTTQEGSVAPLQTGSKTAPPLEDEATGEPAEDKPVEASASSQMDAPAEKKDD